MMSLTRTNLAAVVKKQYVFKLKSCSNLLISLIALQLIAILFTMGGMVDSMSIGSSYMSVTIRFYSGDGVFTFSLIWALATAFILTMPGYRNIDFTFVGNRLSSNLANFGFLLTASITGGISATLGSLMIRNIVYFSGGSENILGTNFFMGPGELLTAMAAAALYLLLLSAVGYFSGTLVQWNRILVLLLPALVVGTLIFEAGNYNRRIIWRAVDFFIQESSLALFALKVTATVLLLWTGTILLTNKTEARA